MNVAITDTTAGEGGDLEDGRVAEAVDVSAVGAKGGGGDGGGGGGGGGGAAISLSVDDRRRVTLVVGSLVRTGFCNCTLES